MIYNQNMTVEEIIKKSVTETKQLNQKRRRKWVRKMLNYYGGNATNEYIKNYFIQSFDYFISSFKNICKTINRKKRRNFTYIIHSTNFFLIFLIFQKKSFDTFG